MVKQFRVLIVDDEVRIIKFLEVKLKASGYEVLTAKEGRSAIEQVQTQEPDLVVLDIVMPGIDGFEALKQIRAISRVPVIVLSARDKSTDKILGLELGADDYLAKPFNPDELVARIETIKRRLTQDDKGILLDDFSVGNLEIDFKSRNVVVSKKDVHLTRIEWLLLSELAQNAGNLMLYEDLLGRIWGPEYRSDIQILRTWISRLRNKIERDPKNPSIIKTVAKTGYMIEDYIS